MSKQHTSNRTSPQKHKGMKTSLYNNEQISHQYHQHQKATTIYTRPNKIFVQTVTQQPNVMPYIDSQYTNQPYIMSETHSQYVPVIQRQNNFIRDVRQPGMVQNVVRVSPLQGSNVATNLSRTKVQHVDHSNRFQGAGSAFVPPPPQSFLINNSTRLPQHRSPSLNKTVITVTPPHQVPPPNFQSVKKTYIPHHIINQIPVVYGNGSVYTESGQHQRANSASQQNDNSKQVLMGYYQNLYVKFQAEKQQNQLVKQQLSDAINQINFLQAQQAQNHTQTVVHETIVQPQKKKVIDRQLLHDLLSQKWNRTVDQVVERRKQACLSQVSKMVQSCKVTIKIPGDIVQQHTNEVYYRA